MEIALGVKEELMNVDATTHDGIIDPDPAIFEALNTVPAPCDTVAHASRAHSAAPAALEKTKESTSQEQRGRAGFARVHTVPENLTDVDDRRATALIVLPPSAPHDASAGPKSKAASLASEALKRRGSAQRRFRNALVLPPPTCQPSRQRERTPDASAHGAPSWTTPTSSRI